MKRDSYYGRAADTLTFKMDSFKTKVILLSDADEILKRLAEVNASKQLLHWGLKRQLSDIISPTVFFAYP